MQCFGHTVKMSVALCTWRIQSHFRQTLCEQLADVDKLNTPPSVAPCRSFSVFFLFWLPPRPRVSFVDPVFCWTNQQFVPETLQKIGGGVGVGWEGQGTRHSREVVIPILDLFMISWGDLSRKQEPCLFFDGKQVVCFFQWRENSSIGGKTANLIRNDSIVSGQLAQYGGSLMAKRRADQNNYFQIICTHVFKVCCKTFNLAVWRHSDRTDR